MDLVFSDQNATVVTLYSQEGVVSAGGDISNLMHSLPKQGVFCSIAVNLEDERLLAAIDASGLDYTTKYSDGEILHLGYRVIRPHHELDPHCQ